MRLALARLPGPQRLVLHRVYVDGLTQAETARRLGLPLATVKAQVYAGLRNLIVLLDEPERNGDLRG